jgi:leucyl/phenylalanyl-tRNA--protein transferase
MAEDKQSDTVNFYRPDMRGQLSINNLHIPKKLLKQVKQQPYDIKINTDFAGVIDGCASEYKNRESTWINSVIRKVFIALHAKGCAHSVEAWQGDKLVGGLYGLAIGRVFCGESMFSKADNASKIALVHLCARLKAAGFSVLDTQFTNPHLEQFGIYEIPQEEYEVLIKTEMNKPTDFILNKWSEATLLKNYFSHIE